MSDMRIASFFVRALFSMAAIAAFAWIQFGSESLAGTDAYYHLKLAGLFQQAPLIDWPIDFPWLPKTVLGNDQFVDHHFLFHLFLIPFVSSSLLLGGKWAAVCFATMVFAAFHFAMPRMKFASAAWASCAFFAVSPGFLYRMSLVRAQSLSLVLILLLFTALRTRRYLSAAVISFIYVWTYNAFPLVLVLVSCLFLGTFLTEKKIDLRAILYPVAGLISGVVINPYFPGNVVFLYHHLIDKFIPTGYAVRVGNEWYPYLGNHFLLHLGLPILALMLTLLMLQPSKVSRGALSLLMFTLILLVMVLKSRRFVELFPCFALLTLLCTLSEAPLSEAGPDREVETPASQGAVGLGRGLMILGLTLVLAFHSVQTARQSVKKAKPYNRFQDSARWLANNSEKGSLVVTSDWDEFPRLFHFNDHNHYLAGLDPYFLYAKDQKLFELWKRLTEGKLSDTIAWSMKHRFKAQFIFVDKGHRKMRKRLDKDPNIERVFSGKDSYVYRLKERVLADQSPAAPEESRIR